MDIKTQCGIYVKIDSDGVSRILSFDKPVRAIELTPTESFQISRMLTTNKKTGITTELRKLVLEEFFNVPRSFRDVKAGLEQKGIRVKSASLNVILNKMLERHELTRIGTEGTYLYQRP